MPRVVTKGRGQRTRSVAAVAASRPRRAGPGHGAHSGMSSGGGGGGGRRPRRRRGGSSPRRGGKFGCPHPTCDRTYSSRQALANHQTTHEEDPRWRCAACGHVSSSAQNLQTHTDRVHRKIRPFACERCDRAFYSKRELHMHSLSIHGRREEAKTKKNLKKRKTIDRTYRPYQSPRPRPSSSLSRPSLPKSSSRSSFTSVAGVTVQIKELDSPPEPCRELVSLNGASDLGSSDEPLDLSMKTLSETSSRSSRSPSSVTITASECSDDLMTSDMINNDNNKNDRPSKIRDYSCNDCEYRTSSPGNLSLHRRRIHMREKQFFCIPCGKDFFLRGEYQSHCSRSKHHRRFLDCMREEIQRVPTISFTDLYIAMARSS